jgi:peroxiredoxin
MNLKIKSALAVLMMSVGFFSVQVEAKATERFTTPKKAENFVLPNQSGNKISLNQFKGKYVVLEWTNHECPFVKKHYGSGNMQTLQQKYTKQEVVWLSIVSSARGKQGHITGKQAKELSASRGSYATYVLLDEKGVVGRLYHAKTTPHIFIIDPNGMIVYQGAIDSIASTDLPDVYKATNYIDQAFLELFANKPVSLPSTSPYGCAVKY